MEELKETFQNSDDDVFNKKRRLMIYKLAGKSHQNNLYFRSQKKQDNMMS